MPQVASASGTRTITVERVTVVVADDRPIVRAGLTAALSGSDNVTIADGEASAAAPMVENWRPDVLIVILRNGDPDPFRAIAASKALRENVRVLVLADTVSAADLREAVVAGADSFVLTTAPLAELRRAIEATARGERVVSPEVAMHLVSSWRPEAQATQRASLTPRELQVLELLSEGLTNQHIADRLTVSPRTIKTHVQNLLSKLDVPDRTGAVARGFRLGLLR